MNHLRMPLVPTTGLVPDMGLTVNIQQTTDFSPSDFVALRASMVRAPDSPLAPNLSDILSDLREMPPALSDTPCGVLDSPPSHSTPNLTDRAMRALHRDTSHRALEHSIPSLMIIHLATVHQRPILPRKEFPSKSYDLDRSDTVFSIASTSIP